MIYIFSPISLWKAGVMGRKKLSIYIIIKSYNGFLKSSVRNQKHTTIMCPAGTFTPRILYTLRGITR